MIFNTEINTSRREFGARRDVWLREELGKAGIFEIAKRVIIDGEKSSRLLFAEIFGRRHIGGRGERFDDGARFDGRLRRKARALSRFRSLGLQG